MTEYFPKSEQIDTLNGKLDALNETLKKREDFVSAVAKMEAATAEAQTAATNANTAAAGVVSPTVTTSKADGVTTVTITDKDGAHTATIEDGAKGDKGDTGADGYSPTATVTKSGTTTTVTVTDKTGTTTAEVKDGSDATVTKDNIVSALGYEPEKVLSFELINDLTMGGTQESIISQDSDGNSFSLREAYVIFDSPEEIDQTVWLGPWSYRWAWIGSQKLKTYIWHVKQIADQLFTISVVAKGDKWSAGDGNNLRSGAVEGNTATIQRICWYFSTSMPENTRVRIYGIRA